MSLPESCMSGHLSITRHDEDMIESTNQCRPVEETSGWVKPGPLTTASTEIEMEVLDFTRVAHLARHSEAHCDSSQTQAVLQEAVRDSSPLDRRGLWFLGAQHLSSAWGSRTAEFAFYLYLIQLFQNTLLPASLYGFFTTGAGIFFSGLMGTFVDKVPKLVLVRWCIVAQKLSAAASYVCYIVLFTTPLRESASRGTAASFEVWILFSVVVLTGMILDLATIAISVAVERDWATCIAGDDDAKLTEINTILRRIDLLCKLLAPLFVSLLTTAASYTFSVAFFGGYSLVAMIFELIWIQIVYNRIPVLAEDDAKKRAMLAQTTSKQNGNATEARRLRPSASIFMIWLSFDGTMLSYLKTCNFSDPFVAGMRGICVVAGLFGTFLMPILESRIGLVRAGSWAIWSEVITLVPVLVSFYVGRRSPEGQHSSAWNTALLFGGMAASRVGLWVFDLCQLKELQTSLATHPRRNRFTALQFALQNIGDILKYVLTIILSRPSQFRWAALVSFISVGAGAVSYMVFVRRVRGHLLHIEYLEGLLGKRAS